MLVCRFEPSYLAVTICKDSESSAKGHRVPYDKKRLDSAYCNRGQKCKVMNYLVFFAEMDGHLRGRGATFGFFRSFDLRLQSGL